MKWDHPNSPYWQYQEGLEALDAEFKVRREMLRETLRKAQKECPHKHTTYHPDPSGNNDSFTECDVCGAEV